MPEFCPSSLTQIVMFLKIWLLSGEPLLVRPEGVSARGEQLIDARPPDERMRGRRQTENDIPRSRQTKRGPSPYVLSWWCRFVNRRPPKQHTHHVCKAPLGCTYGDGPCLQTVWSHRGLDTPVGVPGHLGCVFPRGLVCTNCDEVRHASSPQRLQGLQEQHTWVAEQLRSTA